jgi:hypothetical protein
MGFARPADDEERYPQNLANRWFRALDQRRIDAGTRCWIAHVMGIHLDGREIWIQIAAGDTSEKSLVLHLSGWTTVDQAITAMKTRPVERESFPRVISVIPTV